jgi:hypothetical protein
MRRRPFFVYPDPRLYPPTAPLTLAPLPHESVIYDFSVTYKLGRLTVFNPL